jgi:hypothetical protein
VRHGWFIAVLGLVLVHAGGITNGTPAAVHPPTWVPFMRGVWILDEPAGVARRSATGNAAATLFESVAGEAGPSQGPDRLIPNDTVPGEFRQGSASARWNQTPPVVSGDGHDTFLHCGAGWDDSACAALFGLRGSMSLGCWSRGRDSPVHIEHRMIDHLDLATHTGFEAVWSGGHDTGFHYGCKWWPEPVDREAVSGVSFVVPAGTWGHGVCVLDVRATGTVGRVFSNGVLANDQPWTAPASPPQVGLNISSHASDGRWDGELDECFVAAGALTAAEVCRICSCGVDGTLCACDAAEPTRYATGGTGRNTTDCTARVCIGGTDPHAVHQAGPGEVCVVDGDCPGGGRCSAAAAPCDLAPVACNQPAPSFALPPPEPCVPADCDDGDACTTDACVQGICRHIPEPGLDGVRCRLDALGALVVGAPDAEISPRARAHLLARLSRVRTLVAAAETARPRRRNRDLRRARRRMAATIDLVPTLATDVHIGHTLAALIVERLDVVQQELDQLEAGSASG